MQKPQYSPLHLALCADGNRRWAKKHEATLPFAYRKTVLNIPHILKVCIEERTRYVSFQIFNRSNWNRAEDEVSHALEAAEYLCRVIREFGSDKQISVSWVGSRDRVPASLKEELEALEVDSTSSPVLYVALYIDYDPLEQIQQATVSRKLTMEELKPRGFPPVDLFVRTSTEFRTSSFDPIRIASAELLFLDCGAPEFDGEKTRYALREYAKRNRTFGK